ncbi:MAG: ferredoxin reductase family protein, partial [Actinomycetota bacterium]
MKLWRMRRASSYLGPVLIVVACALPLALWAQAAPFGLRFGDSAATLRSIAVLCGLAGITAFACNLVIGGRFAVLEPLFGSLDRMYRVHHRTGVTSFLLLLAHGALMLASAATDSLGAAVRLVLPSPNWTVTLGALALLAMSIVIGLTLYARLGHEVYLWVHRFFGAVFALGALHAFRTPGTKALSPALTIYLAIAVTAGFAAYAYRSLLGDLLVRRRYFRVTGINRRGGEVSEITLDPLDSQLDFTPGQFVFLTFQSRSMSEQFRPFSREREGQSELVSLRAGAIRKQFHPFSITSSPARRELQVAIKASGDYTGALRHLEVGDQAWIEGPYGRFSHLHVESRRQIWIAGGIGVTPFLSMARSLEPSYDVDLYYATKSRSVAYFIDDFEALARDHPGLHLTVYPEDENG